MSTLSVPCEAVLSVSENESILCFPNPSVTKSYDSVFCSVSWTHLLIPFPHWISFFEPTLSQRLSVVVEIHQPSICLHQDGNVGSYICACIRRDMVGHVGGI